MDKQKIKNKKPKTPVAKGWELACNYAYYQNLRYELKLMKKHERLQNQIHNREHHLRRYVV